MRDIFHTIEQYHMIEPGMRVLAGVSGGADSVCLLYVLKEYQKRIPFELRVVHVEHGLRGEESLEDAAFVEEMCRGLGISCQIVQAGVRQLAQEENLSLEEAGRAERYRIFEEIREAQGAQRIAVAHNQNDQAETVLWNLARGSGLRGLGGIRPVRDEIIRPLLFTSREHIEELLREAGLSWRTDRTNLEQDYTRNKVRLSLLPRMQQELNSKAPEHIAQAAGRLQQVQAFLDRMTQQAAWECIRCKEDVVLTLPVFEAQDPLIQKELLRLALEKAGGLKDVGSVHLEALENLAEMDCGKELSLPGRIRAVRENQVIRFTKQQRNGEARRQRQTGDEPCEARDMRHREYVLPVPGECRVPEAGSLPGEHRAPGEESRLGECSVPGNGGAPEERALLEKASLSGKYQAPIWRIRTEILDNSPELMEEILEEKKCTKWISYDTIKSDILLRHRRAGDYLVVNAQGGRKKLKDYFIDLKLQRGQRDQIWLLAEEAHVLWIPGYRISEAAKVQRETKKVLKIQLEEEVK